MERNLDWRFESVSNSLQLKGAGFVHLYNLAASQPPPNTLRHIGHMHSAQVRTQNNHLVFTSLPPHAETILQAPL